MPTTPLPTTRLSASAAELRAFALAVLTEAGMPADDAGVTADALVWSDLRGVSKHGVTGRLPQLADRLTTGATCALPDWTVLHETPTVGVFDADGAWGQVAGTRGIEAAIAKAKHGGVGMAVVRNCDITAAMGRYASLAVEQGMIGLVINNTPPIIPPWGGVDRVLGNQAFAIGSPAGRNWPILFDSALAVMSHTYIEALRDRGESVPLGIAKTVDGEPTVDHDKAIAGIIPAVGGHRGSGLAMMWEVLTGVLAGGLLLPWWGSDATTGRPMGVSLFCLAIDPSLAMPYDLFLARVDALIDQIHASPPSDGVDRVRVPGERGYRTAETRSRDGIPVTVEQEKRLRQLAETFGVAWIGA